MKPYDYLIVGAGFAGSVCARALADLGKRVRVVEKREHIAGNAFDELDGHGVLVHRYGPHIFHTNSKRVFEFLSRFTTWRFYEHRVRAVIDGVAYPMPINLTTLNRLYGGELDEAGAAAFFDKVREPRSEVKTSEDVVLSSVGRDLCELFFRHYTLKQWGLDLSELSAGVAARIPTRTNVDDRYFTDTFQFMPADGYTAMFARMLDHPFIEVALNTPFDSAAPRAAGSTVVYTGPIDEFFDRRFGPLPYRSLRFEHYYVPDVDLLNETGTTNYPQPDVPFTRITEFKHLSGQQVGGSSLVREIPCGDGEPFYPIPRPENERLYARYRELADATPGVVFVGRLAQYRYYNMDQVVGAALATVDKLQRAGTETVAAEPAGAGP